MSSCWWTISLILLLTVPAIARQDSPDPLLLVQQGRRLNAAGRQAEALELYERALKINPDQFEAHLASGIALDLLARYSEARTHLARAIQLAPEDSKRPALLAMAVSWVFQRRTADAAKTYEQVIDRDTAAGHHADAAEAANALGRLYLETGDPASAKRWYQTGYEQARRQPAEPGSQLALWKFRWLHAQARIAAREGKPTAGLLQEAKALVSSSKELAGEAPAVAYLEGYLALYRKDPKAALTALAGADQQDPFILVLVARAHEQLNDRAAARDTWQRILTLNGHSLQNALARPAAREALAHLQ
jgi:tetratricopeptide (TPR) repeat protein